MSIAALIRQMHDAGAPIEAIIVAVEAMESVTQGVTGSVTEGVTRRSANAERQARFRERMRAARVTESVTRNADRNADGDVTNNAHPLPLSPPSPSPQTPKPQPPLTPAPAEDAHTRGLAETGSVQRIFDAWNAMASTCRARGADKLTDKRKIQIKSRIKDYTEPVILETIAMVPAQQWLMGLNDRGWKADLEFFLRPDSITKIREGKYEHGTGVSIGPVGSYSRGTRPDPAVDMLRAAEAAASAAGDWEDGGGTGDQIPSWLYD